MLFQARGWLDGTASAHATTPLTDLGVFLLILGSVYQAMAGAFFIMAHEYDGWQIGDFAWPDKTGPDPEIANNDRLRLVSYQFLFWFQSLGMGMTAFAISLGGASPDPKVAAGLLVGWFFLSLWKPNDPFNKICEWLKVGSWPVLRTPLITLIVFIVVAALYATSMAGLFGPGAIWAACFFGGGGLLEGLVAESKIAGEHYQLSHLAAVVVISFGACVLMSSIATAAKLAVPWVSTGVQWWLLWLALAGVAMILPARFVKGKKPKQPQQPAS